MRVENVEVYYSVKKQKGGARWSFWGLLLIVRESKFKRICVFCECWESGGIESFIYNVLSNADLNGLEVDIVVSQLKDSIFSDRLKNIGVDFYELSGNQKRFIKNYKMFSELLKERKYDTIHMNIFHAISFIYAIPALKNGVKRRIAHSHNTKIGKCRSYPLKKILHWFFRSWLYIIFTDFWACSDSAAKFMFPKKILSSNKWYLMPNGIDTERFTFNSKDRERIRSQLNVENKTLLINIGRLCEQKNQMFLLDVLNELMERGYDCVLLLIGEGEMLSDLKSRTENLFLTDRVIFYGTTIKVEDMLSAGDVFMFPSIFEGFGIAALEAQAAGLPVICSEHIPKETYITENIRTIPLKEGASKWADAAVSALKHPAQRGKAAGAVKIKDFDIKEAAAKIEAYYRNADF